MDLIGTVEIQNMGNDHIKKAIDALVEIIDNEATPSAIKIQAIELILRTYR